MNKVVRYISFLICALATLSSCTRHDAFRHSEGTAWNTLYHITYRSAVELDDSIRAVIDSVDMALSFFNPNSEVWKLNAAKEFEAREMLRDVYILSSKIWLLTDSVFDPTVSPAITAWGFGKGHEITPDTMAIEALRPLIGMEKTSLRGTRIVKDNPKTEFNFSAIAKGYGVDRIAEMMERNKVEDYLIEIGGEIRTGGFNRRGRPWKIAVDSPTPESASVKDSHSNPESSVLQDSSTIPETIFFSGMGMATSGNYRNFHSTKEGKLFGHTISPRTLRPVKTDLLSVTVLAQTCAEADALATACMAMGFAKSDSLLDRLGHPALFIIESEGKMKVVRNRHLKRLQDEESNRKAPIEWN